jgi:hypothetical protein
VEHSQAIAKENRAECGGGAALDLFAPISHDGVTNGAKMAQTAVRIGVEGGLA